MIKGDFVLVINPKSTWSGHVGAIKKVSLKTKKVVVKLSTAKKTVWFKEKDLMKITEIQHAQFKELFQE
tara:strand:+ start:98 stop:304 length:207 start_codon:yes stop_codon:yes gene_type:complete